MTSTVFCSSVSELYTFDSGIRNLVRASALSSYSHWSLTTHAHFGSRCKSVWTHPPDEHQCHSERQSTTSWQTMTCLGHDVDRGVPILMMKINVTVSFNQVLRDGHMSCLGRDVDRCVPINFLNIKVTSSFNQLLRVGMMSLMDHDLEGCDLHSGTSWRRRVIKCFVLSVTCETQCGQWF